MRKYQWYFLWLMEGLLIFLLLYYPSWPMLLLFGSMQFNLLIIRKAYLINDEWFNGADWLRRTVYFLPYLLVFLIFVPKAPVAIVNVWLCLLLSVLIGIIFLLPRLKELSPFFNKDAILFFPPVSFREKAISTYSLLGSAFLQELYFKGFMLAILFPIVGVWMANLIVAFFFVAEHIVHYQVSQFRKTDFIAQFLLSLFAGGLYMISGSIWTAIIPHLVYNATIALTYHVRYWTHRFEARRSKTV